MDSLKRSIADKLVKLKKVGTSERSTDWHRREELNLAEFDDNIQNLKKDESVTEAEWVAVHDDLLKCKNILSNI